MSLFEFRIRLSSPRLFYSLNSSRQRRGFTQHMNPAPSSRLQMNGSTIAAIATPVGSGGIGIIRISGQDALSIASSIFQRLHPSSPPGRFGRERGCFKSYRLYHGYIVDPENQRVLDEVLLAVMMAPNSYTREDVVEIQAHCGPVVLSSILELVLKSGARLAEPGEFTKRAYINGRIDLTQAEAVIDVINAKTNKSLEIAAAQIKGNMRTSVETIRDSLLHILTEIEAAIDFPDDVGEIVDTDTAIEVIQSKVVDTLKSLINRYKNAHVLRDGLKVVIAGKPNVGKSSLMNCLLQKDRVIVTSIPGTTRDLIEDTLNIRGIPVTITDTAGLHETDDPVEVMGIKKTREYINNSDLVLFMVDASCPLTSDDYKIYEKINGRGLILVINKSDLVDDEFNLDIPDDWVKIPRIKISALYNRGLDPLKDLIAKVSLHEGGFDAGNTIIPNLRHKLALDRSLLAASSAVEGIRAGTPFELIAIDIKEAIDCLDEITGAAINEDVIDQIFSRFCIGK